MKAEPGLQDAGWPWKVMPFIAAILQLLIEDLGKLTWRSSGFRMINGEIKSLANTVTWASA